MLSSTTRDKVLFLMYLDDFLSLSCFRRWYICKFYFYNYGMKRLPWRNATKRFVGLNNEKILGPLQLDCRRGRK